MLVTKGFLELVCGWWALRSTFPEQLEKICKERCIKCTKTWAQWCTKVLFKGFGAYFWSVVLVIFSNMTEFSVLMLRHRHTTALRCFMFGFQYTCMYFDIWMLWFYYHTGENVLDKAISMSHLINHCNKGGHFNDQFKMLSHELKNISCVSLCIKQTHQVKHPEW